MAGSHPWLRRRSGVPSGSAVAICVSARGGLGGSGPALALDVVGEDLELGQVVTGGLTKEEVAMSKRSRPVRRQDGCQPHSADSNGISCTVSAEISAFAEILAAEPIARARDRSTRGTGNVPAAGTITRRFRFAASAPAVAERAGSPPQPCRQATPPRHRMRRSPNTQAARRARAHQDP